MAWPDAVLCHAAGHPTVHADTAFGPEKLRFMQEQAWMEPQQVLAEDRAFLQRSLDKRIRPRVLLMLFREHPGCWNFPGDSSWPALCPVPRETWRWSSGVALTCC